MTPCPVCQCTHRGGQAAHAIAAALACDDLDAAIEAGLLESTGCPECSMQCTERLLAARDARVRALAARERYRARQARLERRARDRGSSKVAAAPPTDTAAASSALPAAAAAALERAKARAAQRRKP